MPNRKSQARAAAVFIGLSGLFVAGLGLYSGCLGKYSAPDAEPFQRTPPPEALAPWIHYPVVSGSNEVRNGGFEDALSGWHLPAGASLDETFKYSGRASLRLEGNPNERVALTQSLPNLKPNARYRLTYAIKTREVVPDKNAPLYFCGICGAALNVWAGTGKNLWFPARGAMTGSVRWTVLGFEFDTAPKPAEGNYYLRINLDYSGGTAWFDDIDIMEIISMPEQTRPR